MAYRDRYERREQWRKRNKNSGSIVGLVLLGIGALLFARVAGLPIPDFLFTWQVLLIVIGLVLGITSRFRNPGFFAPIVVGTAFLLKDYFPELFPQQYLVPAVLVVVGIYLIFKPRYKNNKWAHTDSFEPITDTANTSAFQAEPGNAAAANTYPSDRLQETAVFGNIRKTMISKNFGGGEVSSVFGSAEINLMQADLQQQAKLELNAVFGSIRLIVPTHWQIKMETAAVLGGVEDKRPKHAIYSDKILLLEGNAVFGGIQIESH